LTGDRNFQGQADPRIAPFTLPVNHVAERLELFRGDAREDHAVEAAALCSIRVLPPDHAGLRLNGPSISLDLNPDRALEPQTFGQFHTGPPLAQVAAPAHTDIQGGAGFGSVQEREGDSVPGEAALYGIGGQGVASDGSEHTTNREIYARKK
jgi:hypothetical protein